MVTEAETEKQNSISSLCNQKDHTLKRLELRRFYMSMYCKKKSFGSQTYAKSSPTLTRKQLVSHSQSLS